jgi:hypothetical protein
MCRNALCKKLKRIREALVNYKVIFTKLQIDNKYVFLKNHQINLFSSQKQDFTLVPRVCFLNSL